MEISASLFMVNKDYIDKSEEKNPDRTVFHPVGVESELAAVAMAKRFCCV